MTKLDERAALAHMVIGPERREKLIDQNANGLSLNHGMPLDRARKYAESCFESADTVSIIRIGQVWSRKEGQKLPGDVISEMLGRDPGETYTVDGFEGEMVHVGEGRFINVCLFAGLHLVAWPESFTLDEEAPQPPQQPITEDDEAEVDGERFDPHSLWTLTYRSGEWSREKPTPYLPLLGDHYTAVNMYKPELEPGYSNKLDIPAYLFEHLADYRAGWPDWSAQNDGEWIDHFNELDNGCECDVSVSAYLGHWLWQRLRSDFVSEHGGTVDDYDAGFMWAPGMADLVLEVAPFADPEWNIPADHPLAQCEGQDSLFATEAAA
jgi:hypothetical protein